MVFRNTLSAMLLSALILGGCATSNVQSIARGPTSGPLRVVVVESPNNIDPAALRNVFAPGVPRDSDEARTLVQSGMAEAEARAMAEMQNALTKVGITVLGSETISRSVNRLEDNNTKKELGYEHANELRTLSGADDLLRFHITDYGQTPRAWQKWVIGFEVVSTIGIATIAYSVPKTRPLAGAYLVTETIEETVEAYTGFWALDKLGQPVRIDAELIDLPTGEKVWADSSTGLANIHIMRLVADVDTATRNHQLEDATHDSIEKLTRRLVSSLAHTGTR